MKSIRFASMAGVIGRPGLIVLFLAILLAFGASSPVQSQSGPSNPIYLPIIMSGYRPNLGPYVLLGWNDLGMHCYNHDFQDLAVLPPYNTLWAQVIKRGDPPQIVTQGIRVQYSFPDNKTSSNKTNFWTYAGQLFGVALPDNVGLKGKGLADVMNAASDHFIAEGFP